MRWVRCLVLLACAGSWGCSSDGGPVGTGVSSTAAISGNVVDVQTSAATSGTHTLAALPPIQVSIDGLPNLRTVVDDSGNFVLSGNFAGSVTMRFAVPQFQVTQQLDVPAGSTVVLQDIELQPDSVVVQAARQFNFFGTVDFIDCADGTLLIHERRAGGLQYHVHLNDQSSLVDAAGNAQTCAAIRVGGSVTIEGTIAYAAPDGTITALVLTLSPFMPPPGQQEFDARFAGALAALDCNAGFVAVDDSVQRTTVQLTEQTRLSGGTSGTLTCAELRVGDRVHGAGRIALHMPGIIVATTLEVTGPPSSGQALRFVGVVTTIDCAAGTLQLSDDHAGIGVQVSATTVITTRDGQSLPCTGIHLGDRLVGVGQLAADGSGTVVAERITVKHPGFMNPVGSVSNDGW
jgi:hypothetical protein